MTTAEVESGVKDKFVNHWRDNPLQSTGSDGKQWFGGVFPKLHWLDIHCVQTLSATKTGFGVISEQGVEAIHKVVNFITITNVIIQVTRICLAFALIRVIAFYFVRTFLLILYVTTGYLKCCLIYSRLGWIRTRGKFGRHKECGCYLNKSHSIQRTILLT